MARAQRQDFEGGWHHVMNRGAARQQIFFTQGDGQTFEQLLAEGSELAGVEIHAFCLMSNHFHLLLHCPHATLSSFMHRLGSLYVRRFNRRTQRDGPMFRARFHSLVVDSPQYLDRVGRYVHRNPLDVRPQVALDRYRWSSYQFYVGSRPAPDWLHTSVLLGMHNGGRSDYARFVEGGVEPQTVRLQPLLGAIEMILDERITDDRIGHRGLSQTIAIAMLDRLPEPLRSALAGELQFRSPGAQRVAVHRARRRVAETPLLLDVIDRALELTG